MFGPIVVLAAASLVGWIALSLQSLYLPSLSTNPDLLSSSLTVAVASSVLLLCYEAFLSRRAAFSALVEANGPLRAVVGALESGLGFDRFYAALVQEVYSPLSRLVSRMQTGDLGDNMLLLLVALGIVLAISVLEVA